jgi:hypothetical protein
LPQRQGGAGARALLARQGTQTLGLRASSSADVADGDTQHESKGGRETAPTSDRLAHAAILEMTGPMPGNHPKDSHKRQPSNAHAFPLYWRGQDHAARQFWHARLTPFTRSHRSRATRSRLPRLPRPALSLRGWRPGAGQTPAASTRRLQPAPRSPTDRRGATNTKDEALLLRMQQLGSNSSSEAPTGSAIRRAAGAALADPSGLSGQAHNYEAARTGIMNTQ